MSIGTLLFIGIGILYIVFAYREPPAAVAHLFKIPAAFVFFAEERRVKLGRIAVGALLIAAGIGWALPGGSIVGTIGGLLFVGVQIAARWKLAGDDADALAAERKAARGSFEALKGDPRFVHLHQQLYAKGYRTAFDRAPDAATYCIRYIGLMDEKYGRLFAPDAARARYLVAYLERRDSPARIQATLDLQSGVCAEMEAGRLGWDGMIPLMY
jgi:hypothetical protein